MDKAKTFRVIVIGGGNAGLALAQGLKTANIECLVFERDSSHEFHNKARDWGMLLHWGTHYLKQLLPPHMQERMIEPTVDKFYNWTDGAPVVDMNGKTGEVILRVQGTDPLVRVSRRKLRKFLSEGLDIRFGKKLSDVRVEGLTVIAVFEDGSTETGDFLVGADGSRSKVRQILVGAEAARPEELPFTVINYSAGEYTAEQARLLRRVHPIVKLAYHPENQGLCLVAILDVPDPDKPEDWKFQVFQSWRGPPYAKDLSNPALRMSRAKSLASEFCEPFRTAFLALDDEAVLPVDAGQQWKPIKWDNLGGRVTLAGDAAHSMLPHRGQGLNHALQDSAEIMDAVKSVVFGGKALKDAIDAYEEEMRPRCVKAAELSLQTAEMGAAFDKFRESPTFKLGHNKDKS